MSCLAATFSGCKSETRPGNNPKTATEQASPTAQPQRKDGNRLALANQYLANGDTDNALKTAKSVLIAKPKNAEALRIVALAHAELGNFQDAALTAETLFDSAEGDRRALTQQLFYWWLRGQDPSRAESLLIRQLKNDPGDHQARRSLAQLLNSQGRRFEGSMHVRKLVRENVATHHELMSLIDLAGPFNLVDFGELAQPAGVSLFQLGEARELLVAKDAPDQAIELAQTLQNAFPNDAATASFVGRLMADRSDTEAFVRWHDQLPPGIETHPEYWFAVATWAKNIQHYDEAVRAYAETLQRDPTNRAALRELSDVLLKLGKDSKVSTVRDTLTVLETIFRTASVADATEALSISQQLQKLARPWESLAWYRYSLQLRAMSGAPVNLNQQQPNQLQLSPAQTQRLAQRAMQIGQWEEQGTQQQIAEARVRLMVGFDPKSYPKPKIVGEAMTLKSDTQRSEIPEAEIRLVDVATEIGLQTSFISDYPLDRPEFFLHQANGGGIAVVDYDLNGLPDMYFAQSGGDPQIENDSAPNQLFRQIDDSRFADVASTAGVDDLGFGQGVCAGDMNQDGLPDLLVANIGQNRFFINQGDGTFRSGQDLVASQRSDWTSSIALGDLDGDALPELIEVNYLDDPSIFSSPCKGKDLACTPQRFHAAIDRIYRCDPSGTFSTSDLAEDLSAKPNYGFGIVIANFDRMNGNDVFVSNDGDLNHYWVSSAKEKTDGYRLIESAIRTGCNVGVNGVAQGSMGIASADFDRNGFLDLIVTNFHNEPVNLYGLTKAGFFNDVSSKLGLDRSSRDVLGFGTQAGDFDNDGWKDLAVLNGHIYDARYADIPFRMQSQLYRGGQDGFALKHQPESDSYWGRKQLGRTLVTTDFNRDGKLDLVANHLDQPVAVLQNETDTGNWLQIELLGVESEREATGALVSVVLGGTTIQEWQIAGDGYMCTNESMIHVGVGSEPNIETIEVRWPSGAVDRIHSVKANQRLHVIEGQGHFRR